MVNTIRLTLTKTLPVQLTINVFGSVLIYKHSRQQCNYAVLLYARMHFGKRENPNSLLRETLLNINLRLKNLYEFKSKIFKLFHFLVKLLSSDDTREYPREYVKKKCYGRKKFYLVNLYLIKCS